MAGYKGLSMSNNAVAAYGHGEKPLSKWTKAELVEEVLSIADAAGTDDSKVEALASALKKAKADDLRRAFLVRSSWHHTSRFFNETNFYSVSENAVERAAVDGLESVVFPAAKKPEKKAAVADGAPTAEECDRVYLRLQVIFAAGVLPLKTFGGLLVRYEKGVLDADAVFLRAVEKIQKQDAGKAAQWERLPDGHYRRTYADLYRCDPAAYAVKEYGGQVNRRCKEYQRLKKALASSKK